MSTGRPPVLLPAAKAASAGPFGYSVPGVPMENAQYTPNSADEVAWVRDALIT
jgi:hypothetical protein